MVQNFIKTVSYTIIQCDAIRWEQFFGDFVLDRVNMAYRDADNIFDQIYEKRIFSDFYYENLNFIHEENVNLKKYSTIQQKNWVLVLLKCWYELLHIN